MFDLSASIVNGKVDSKKLSDLLHNIAGAIADGKVLGVTVYSGLNQHSKSQWLKIAANQ